MMKAWFFNAYGSVDALQFGEIPVPTPGPSQVLVKVCAAALNPVDLFIFQYGAMRRANDPFPLVPGCDVAGVVAEVGSDVSNFKKGDEVYGENLENEMGAMQVGSLAEYTVIEERVLALKPSNLSFEEAASLPLAVLTALQSFDMGGLEKGESVFIVGGAGGVGSLAIQVAKNFFEASRVVATCSTGKVEFVKSLGADDVVDYTKKSYDQVVEKFDFLLDTRGHSAKSYVVVKEGGKYADIAGSPAYEKAVEVHVQPEGKNLERLAKCIESGKVKAVIDPKGPFPFSAVPEAYKHLETQRARDDALFNKCSCSKILKRGA